MDRLDRLARERERLLDRLGGLPPERLASTPEPGTWSPLEVVEHMIQAEEYCLLAHLPAERLRVRPRTLVHRIAYRLVLLILRGPVRVSTPVDDMDPSGTATLDELAARWRASQSRLREITSTVSDPSRDAVFRHPVAGPMTPAQAIRMLAAHQTRHVRQIEDRTAIA